MNTIILLNFYFQGDNPFYNIWHLVMGFVWKINMGHFNLEKLHQRAARIIWGYAWDMPSNEVRRLANWRTLKLFYDIKLLVQSLTLTTKSHPTSFKSYSLKEKERVIFER